VTNIELSGKTWLRVCQTSKSCSTGAAPGSFREQQRGVALGDNSRFAKR